MQNKNSVGNVFAVYFGGMVGFVLGAIAGGIIASLFGFGLLLLFLKLAHASGDQATGMGGLILLVVPVGLIIGGCLGCIQGMKLFAQPREDD